MNPRALPLVLAAAILGISVSGPLARLADAPPLAIAVWRLLLSLVAVAVMLAVTGTWREWRGLSRRDVGIAAIGGAMLALHFWSWIASLGMTSVAASVLLVNLHPVVIVGGSALWLGERPSRQQVGGIVIAILGAVVVGFAGASTTRVSGALAAMPSLPFISVATVGNLLAIVGAGTVGFYYLVGRDLRGRLSLWPYVGLVYGSALLVLLLLAVWRQTALWPYAPRELGIFALIALGPMLVGHTGFNWSLKYVPAFVVSLCLLAEPIGAALIARVFLQEAVTFGVALGGGIVLTGLAVSVLAGNRKPNLPAEGARALPTARRDT